MKKLLTKIVLGNDIGQMLAEKVIKKIVKDQLGVDLAMTIRECEINGTENGTTKINISVCFEMANDDIKKVIDQCM